MHPHVEVEWVDNLTEVLRIVALLALLGCCQ